MSVRFYLSWSWEVRLLTILALLICLSPLIGYIILEKSLGNIYEFLIVSGVLLLFLFPLLGYFMSQSPRYYSVESDGVYVQLLLWKKVFKYSEYEIDLEHNYQEDLKGAWRIFASGGFFGYLGVFRGRDKKISNWYITNRQAEVFRIRNKKTNKYTYINKGTAQ